MRRTLRRSRPVLAIVLAGLCLSAVTAFAETHAYTFVTLGTQGGPPTIYGPPGTRQLVEGTLASMRPGAEGGYGLPDAQYLPPGRNVSVVEMIDGSVVRTNGFTVRTAENTHYSFAPGSEAANRFKSLSFRFDLPERSIVYTGDTGLTPEQVGQLAARAGVPAVVVTHLARITGEPTAMERYREEIRRHFAGKVTIANDLDRF